MKSYMTEGGVRVTDDGYGGLLWSFQGHQPRNLAKAGLLMACEDPDRTWLGMETDCSGVQLLECPMSIVGADADALLTLLGDLARLCRGRGFRRDDRSWDRDDQIGWARVPDPAESGVRLKDDLPRLGIDAQVEAVLRGDSKRLDLPESIPFGPPGAAVEFATLAEARRHKGPVAAWFCSGVGRDRACFLRVPLELIAVDEDRLAWLCERLARRDMLVKEPPADRREWVGSVAIRSECNDDALWLSRLTWVLDAENLGDRAWMEAVLRGDGVGLG